MPARLYHLLGLTLVGVLFFAPTSYAVAPDDRPASNAPGASEAVPEYGEDGMVVAAHPAAAEAGRQILEQGGNAVDASVAVGFALAVVYPRAGNLGGGGFLVLRQPDGTATTIDHRETAPEAATPDVYLDARGNAVPNRSRSGHLASGVPGTVDGLLHALENYGTLSRAEVMAPAIQLAIHGFEVQPSQAEALSNAQDDFNEFASTRRYFGSESDHGGRYEPGQMLRQPDLANVLIRIRENGRDGFYKGPTANLIVSEMRRGDGLITHEDLESYTSVEREPVVSTYREHRVLSMGPPSSGGVALAQLLNAAEMHDVAEHGLNASTTIHTLGEAMRRVYADRAEWMGDPDFAEMPLDGLADPDYMRTRMANVQPDRITPTDSVSHGMPPGAESMETTHYSVVDADGQAVSVTTTINSSYGSNVVVDGAGFFLNNEMNDFSLKPGVPNQYGLVGSERNAVAPEKRMLSSMTPTIVEDPDGRLRLVIGSPGGSTIITTVFQVIMNVIDHEMDIEQAITAPRFHHQWKPDTIWLERHGFPQDVQDNLEARGWPLNVRSRWGRAHGVHVRYDEDGTPTYHGSADPRLEGVAVGL